MTIQTEHDWIVFRWKIADISLECSGFLAELGYDTSVMVRSQLLRGFDRQCVDKIEQSLHAAGVHFIRNAVPTKLEKRDEDGKIVVHYDRDGVNVTV